MDDRYLDNGLDGIGLIICKILHNFQEKNSSLLFVTKADKNKTILCNVCKVQGVPKNMGIQWRIWYRLCNELEL